MEAVRTIQYGIVIKYLNIATNPKSRPDYLGICRGQV
jgi:hypothetical protein